MSLGTGRRRTDEEEYELAERISSSENTHVETRTTRENSMASMVTESPGQDDAESRNSAETAPKAEALPPYIPPARPASAVIAERPATRVISNQSRRGSGNAPRRASFPRVMP